MLVIYITKQEREYYFIIVLPASMILHSNETGLQLFLMSILMNLKQIHVLLLYYAQ